MLTATPTPDLGRLRRLPRQAMDRAGASPRTIKNAVLFLFWSDRVSACSLLFFVSVFPSRRRCFVRSHFFTYALLTTALLVSRIRRKALKYIQDAGMLQSVLCVYICLANHSAVSKPHPTEGAGIYAGCRFSGCCNVCCAVCTLLCAGRCAPCLCCSLFVCCRDFAFSNGHDTFLEINETRTSTYIHHMYHM